MSRAPCRLADVDLTDLDNFAHGFPHELFVLHRREAPVWWHEPTEHTPDGEGFWSVAAYRDVIEVLRDPRTFSSERGGHRRHGGRAASLSWWLRGGGVECSLPCGERRHRRSAVCL